MNPRYAVLLVLVAVSVAACGRRTAQPNTSQPTGQPRFTSVVLTDDKNSKVAKASFSPETLNVYTIFTLADVPAGSTIKSVWIAEKTDVAETNYRIDEASLTMGGNITSGNFSLSRPTNGWPPGQYRVELYISDRLDHTARFQITGTAAAAVATPSEATTPSGPPAASGTPIGEIVFATGLQNGRPVDVATSFERGVRRIYAFFPFRGLRAEDTVEGIWYRDGGELYRRSDTVGAILGSRFQPTGNLWFWLNWPDGAPAGSYWFEVRVNGQAAGSSTFEVRS